MAIVELRKECSRYYEVQSKAYTSFPNYEIASDHHEWIPTEYLGRALVVQRGT